MTSLSERRWRQQMEEWERERQDAILEQQRLMDADENGETA